MTAWNWWAVESWSGKLRGFHTTPVPCDTEAEFAVYVGTHWPGLQFVRAEEAFATPERRLPVPKRATMFGIKAIVMESKRDGTQNVDHFADGLPVIGDPDKAGAKNG